MTRRKRPRQLSDDETLRRFVQHVAALRERPYLFGGLQEFTFQIKTDPATKRVSSTIREGDREQLRSFLAAFRKLHANDEPANMPRTLNVALRNVNSGHCDLRERLTQIRASWNHTGGVGFIQMKQQGVTLTPAVCFDLWLNGEVFHSDEEKRELLERLRSAAVPSVTIQFLWSLQYLVALALLAEKTISEGLSAGAFELDVH